MNKTVTKAYELLVPNDQLVIDAMIASLVQKDKQIRDLVAHISKQLDEKE